jgi:hypothetical protein
MNTINKEGVHYGYLVSTIIDSKTTSSLFEDIPKDKTSSTIVYLGLKDYIDLTTRLAWELKQPEYNGDTKVFRREAWNYNLSSSKANDLLQKVCKDYTGEKQKQFGIPTISIPVKLFRGEEGFIRLNIELNEKRSLYGG